MARTVPSSLFITALTLRRACQTISRFKTGLKGAKCFRMAEAVRGPVRAGPSRSIRFSLGMERCRRRRFRFQMARITPVP